MAGSYEHCVDDTTGGYRGPGLLENMGDMTEAVEHMFFMINQLAEWTYGAPEEKKAFIEKASDAYYECLRGEKPWPDFMKPWSDQR